MLSALRIRVFHAVSCAVLVLCMVASLASPFPAQAQKSGKAMTKTDLIGLLEGGVPAEKLREAAQKYGIAFEMNAPTETELRDAGAEDDLIQLLRRLAPKPAVIPTPRATGPAVLMVEVTPGGAQVYVDDEPQGSTSQAGRLRLSQLSPGAHTVRVSLAGHRDFEQSVDLVAGETARVSGALEAAQAPAVVNPLAGGGTRPTPAQEPPPTAPGPGASGGEPGALGVQVANQTPPGSRGAYINEVSPGSPAEKAGLRSGHSIVSLNGRQVNSSDELLQLILTYRAGQVIQIGYMDNGTYRTTSAQLVRRAAPSASATDPAPAQPNPLPVRPGYTPQTTLPVMPTARYTISHDHGQTGQTYCVGVLSVGGGRVIFQGNNSAHIFDFALSEIKEAKKNSVYLANYGAFHIRLKSGPNYNFVVLNSAGQYQPPDELLRTIGMALGWN